MAPNPSSQHAAITAASSLVSPWLSAEMSTHTPVGRSSPVKSIGGGRLLGEHLTEIAVEQRGQCLEEGFDLARYLSLSRVYALRINSSGGFSINVSRSEISGGLSYPKRGVLFE